jgi:hypothetical protein
MASIINATTSSGLIVSPDQSGILQLQSGTNIATMPAATGTIMVSGNMPAFSAYVNTSNTIPNSSTGIVTYNVKDFDTANAYNNTASTVTLNGISAPMYSFAPNVAGYYQITASVYGGTSAGTTWVSILKNGAEYQRGVQAAESCEIAGVLVYCNGTSDYIQAQFTNASGSSLAPGSYSFFRFTGALIRTA